MLYIVLAAAAIALDQALKILVVSTLGMWNEIQVIPGFFYIHCIPNDGIAMGFLAGKQIVVVIVTALIMAGIAAYILKNRSNGNRVELILLTLILAGGIGNLIDRVRLGYVVDFLDFRVWSYIFNFADICVVLGCIFLFIWVFKGVKEE
ncbi:MAG: signal peptidase II [Clostridia bacterium]|nr:signal peptidase II [Clostridia bacterium]